MRVVSSEQNIKRVNLIKRIYIYICVYVYVLQRNSNREGYGVSSLYAYTKRLRSLSRSLQ